MSKLWTSVLTLLQDIGNRSGCHQMPDRSFKIKNYTFPVCSRCTGVFIGQVLAIGCICTNVVCNIYLSILLLLIMGADWFVQHIKIKESTNIRRLITGTLGGFGLFHIYFNIILFVINLFK